MIKLIYAIFFINLSINFIYCSEWESHWFHGVNAIKDGHYDKAIEEYSLAINLLKKHEFNPNLVSLYNERANAYIKNGCLNEDNYEKAIKDLTFVIENSKAVDHEKINAHFLRAQAYLALGKIQDSIKDINFFENKNFYFLQLEEDKEYAHFKLNDFMISNKNIEKSFIRLLLVKNIIDSDNDIVFTISGKAIVKKAKNSPSLSSLFIYSSKK